MEGIEMPLQSAISVGWLAGFGRERKRKRKRKRLRLREKQTLSLSLSLLTTNRGRGERRRRGRGLSQKKKGKEKKTSIFSLLLSSLLFLSLHHRSLRFSPGLKKMDHDETGCQAPPEGPILCINNCGFFGSVATMNMCSKCYKDAVLKQEQAKLAASSIENIVNGSSSSSSNSPDNKDPVVASNNNLDLQVTPVEPKPISTTPTPTPAVASPSTTQEPATKPKQGPNRCTACKKRVGLTGFNCRCGNLFCSLHRYSDKHECPFDYRTAGRDAIAKANPVVKAEKLDKI